MRLPRFSRARSPLAAALTAACALMGCAPEVECTSDVTDGSVSSRGIAVGKIEDEELRRAALRDACRGRCNPDRAAADPACVAACVTDVSARKLGARTTCGRK